MESHHPQIIKALLDAGVDINAVDEQNCTALVHLVKWRPMLSSSHNMWMMGMIALLEGKPDPFIKTAKVMSTHICCIGACFHFRCGLCRASLCDIFSESISPTFREIVRQA